MNMLERLIKGLYEFVITEVIIFFLPIRYSVKYMFRGKDLYNKIMILIGYVGMIVACIMWMKVRCILVGIYFTFSVLGALAYLIFNKKEKKGTECKLQKE